MVLGGVEQIGHIEDYQREVVGGIDARVYVPQEPLVVKHQSLFYASSCSEAISFPVVTRSQYVRVRGMYIVALVQLPLQPRQAHEHR